MNKLAQRLFDAACKGDVAGVRAAIKAGADVHAQAALAEASTAGHVLVVIALLRAGADVNSNFGLNLYFAASRGHLAVVQCLLAAGTYVQHGDDAALRAAVAEGHLEIAEVLLASGADVHAKDDEALVSACRSGNLQMVSLLIGAGADVHAQEGKALCVAAEYDHQPIIERLHAAGAQETTPLAHFEIGLQLIAAAQNGDQPGVLAALAAGADVHAQNSKPVREAARLGDMPLFRCLLAESCEPIEIGFYSFSGYSNAVQTTWLRDAKSLPELDPVRLALVGACPEAVCILLERQGHADLAAMLKAMQMLEPLEPEARADLLENMLAQHPQPESPHAKA